MTGVVRVELGIDCADAARLAPFWAIAVDGEVVGSEDLEVRDPQGRHPTIWFQTVPEGKVVKNRLHLDIWFADQAAAEQRSDELTGAGGTVVRRHQTFWLLQDPEGNELCLCWPAGGSA